MSATALKEQAAAIAEELPLVSVEHPRIETALALVAGDVREVRKSGHNSSQNFNFRGIDAVVNAVGPAFRARGVVCLPMVEHIDLQPMPLSGGKQATRVVVTVRYRFHGPAGDHLDAVSVGEAFDMGDKATAKAMSVAYRTCLLQALTIPTDDPDPDEHSYEQAPPPEASPSPLAVAKQRVLALAKGDKAIAKDAWAYMEDDLAGDYADERLIRLFEQFMAPPDEPEAEG